MTETEWLTSEDPVQMVRLYVSDEMPWPRDTQAPVLSGRKLRLFALACSRMLSPNGYWEGHAKEDTAVRAYAEGLAEGRRPKKGPYFSPYCQGLDTLVAEDAIDAARAHARFTVDGRRGQDAASLLRDVVGNPFRPLTLPPGPEVTCAVCGGDGNEPGKLVPHHDVAPNCKGCNGTGRRPGPCPWITPTVLSLAEAAYELRLPDGSLDPFRLALLADALEEAGCTAATLLNHLHGPPPHVRGCWAVDLVLGKE
jgi:hypothetical protein